MDVIDPYSLDPVIENNAQDDYVRPNRIQVAADVAVRPSRAAEFSVSS